MNSKPVGSKYCSISAFYFCRHCNLYFSATDTKTHLKEVIQNLTPLESSVSQVPSAKPAGNSNVASSKPKSTKKNKLLSGQRKITDFFQKNYSLEKGTVEAKSRESLPKLQTIGEIPLAVRNIDYDSEEENADASDAEMARIIKESLCEKTIFWKENRICEAVLNGWINTEGGINKHGVDQSFFCLGHTVKWDNRAFYCTFCGRFYKKLYYEAHLQAHLQASWSGNEEFPSEPSFEIDYKEPEMKVVAIDQTQLSNSRQFKCKVTECEFSANNKRSLRKHEYLHTRETPFKCPSCSIMYSHLGNLCKHLLFCHSDNDNDAFKVHACDFRDISGKHCSSKFALSADLHH